MPSWPIVAAVSSTKCNWSTDRNTPLALNVSYKINKFVIREQAHWEDRYLFQEQQSAETHFYFEIVSVPVAFTEQGPEQPLAVAACRLLLCSQPRVLAQCPSLHGALHPASLLPTAAPLCPLSWNCSGHVGAGNNAERSFRRLITIPATAREEIFDSQGHLRAFKDAESRQQEAFSLPAQLVLYYWLLHTVPTWLFESTLKIFRYFYFIFLCNLTSVFGMFPARVGVGKQSWLGITGEIILDRAGSHQPCKLKYMFSTAVMHSDWNLWFTNSVGAIFLMAWGRGNRFVLCLEVKRPANLKALLSHCTYKDCTKVGISKVAAFQWYSRFLMQIPQ